MKTLKPLGLLTLLLIGIGYGVITMATATTPTIYNYPIKLGAPREYEMVYDFNHNYFTDKEGKPFLYFTSVGGSPNNEWAEGTQATLLSEHNPLPHGIKMRWFSVTENQFWQGEYQFDQNLLQQLSQHTVNNVINRRQVPFTDIFSFTVYAVPGGLVTVWITGGGEKYLLAQFQAKKVEEHDWDSFDRSTLQARERVTREQYIAERMNDPNSKMSIVAQKQLTEGTFPYNSAPWKRLMKAYAWQLIGTEDFQLKDYWAWYVNGEKLFTYHTDNQTLLPPRAVPYFISFYIEDKQQKLHRINVKFDKEEIMAGFEKFKLTPPIDDPIILQIQVTPNMEEIFGYLIKGDTKLELTSMHGNLQNLYGN